MNSLKNHVQLIGRLGADPEIKQFESGKKKASFAMATNDVYKNADGEKVEETHWHQVVAWEKKADLIEQYLVKGSEVAISGRLTYRDYETDGQKKYVTEINLKELLLMDGKKG